MSPNTRNEVLIEVPGQHRRRRLSVLNTRVEHDRLLSSRSGGKQQAMRLAEKFFGERRGSIAIITALYLPVLVAGSATAVEYGRIIKRKAELQKAVDTAALTSAGELSIAGS